MPKQKVFQWELALSPNIRSQRDNKQKAKKSEKQIARIGTEKPFSGSGFCNFALSKYCDFLIEHLFRSAAEAVSTSVVLITLWLYTLL
jgi:hypothetical protein